MTDEEIKKEASWLWYRTQAPNFIIDKEDFVRGYLAGRRKGLDEIIRLKQEIRDLRGIEFVPFDERVG